MDNSIWGTIQLSLIIAMIFISAMKINSRIDEIDYRLNIIEQKEGIEQ